MSKTLILAVVLLYISSVNCTNCVRKDNPSCSKTLCGNDHEMWNVSIDRCPKKLCCPKGSGNDVVFCKDNQGGDRCTVYTVSQNLAANSDQYKCVDVNLGQSAKSVYPFNNCFRIYDKENCEGKTLIAAPLSPNRNNLAALPINKIQSVGQCFSEDTCTQNNCRFASDVLTVGVLPRLPKDTENLSGPVIFYQRSPSNNRTEVMEAVILPEHLNKGSDTTPTTRAYAKKLGNSGDDAGHILANRLGGSGKDVRNIFPQSSNFNRGAWARFVEAVVADVVQRYGKARYTVNLHYEKDTDTRPTLLVYRILRGDKNILISQGDLLNPIHVPKGV